jgi:K+-sensing histidine kinase KdpD
MPADNVPQPGRLKIFLGAAPGVGKTTAMLRQAQARRADGVDVVIGLVDTHGRQDTEELVGKLETIPGKQIEYRGHVFWELDVDAIRERRPGLVIVDELAHTNVPGSANNKRYVDVQELLDTGIDVFTTLNVQHIEGLSDEVARITWAVVHETVPDSMLKLADEIEVVDLAPSDLIARFKEGKVDLAKHAGFATHNFFSEQNLAGLRALALQLAKKAPVRRILIAFDGSPSTTGAVQHVVSLARAGHRGKIVLLNVQSVSADAEAARTILETASRLLNAQQIPFRSEILAGKPADVIAEAIDRHQIDLVVMGATGLGLARLLLGSVALGVAQRAKVPVTLVK